MTTFFTETFPSVAPAFGGDQSWTEITGNWVNAGSNTATTTLGGSVAWARCDTTAPSADMATTVTVTACPSGRTAGVAARMTNSGTLLLSQSFYAADFHFDTGTCYILKVVSGSTTVLTSVAFTAPSFPCDITMSVYGTALGAYLNGTSIWSGTDTSVTSGSKAGLDAYNSFGDVVFSNLRVATAFQAMAAISGSDSATFAETATLTVLAADGLTVAETAAVTVNITSSDTAQMLAAPGGYGIGGYGEGLYGEGGYGSGGGTALTVSIGVIPASPDAGTVAESASFAATVGATDGVSFADLTTVTGSFTSSDAATVAEGSSTLTAAVAGTDSAGVAEGSPTFGLTGVSDTASLAESTPAVALSGPVDTATLADAGQVAAALADTDGATSADAGGVGALGLFGSDTATLTDSATLTVTVGDSDGASVAELASVTASLSDADGVAFAEAAAVAVIKTDTDSATLAEAAVSLVAAVADVDVVALTASGDGYGSGGYGGGPYGGSVPLISLTGADAASVVDLAALSPSVSDTDTATLGEPAPAISVASSDVGSVAESSAVTQLHTDSDTATVADATSLAPSVSGVDGAVVADTVSSLAATPTGADAATLAETATVSATLAGSDSGSLGETPLIGLADTDSASLAEATPAITLLVSDLHVVIDSLTSLTAAVAGTDTASVAMTGDSGMPAAIQLTAGPDAAGLADAVSSLTAAVTSIEPVTLAEGAPAIGLSSLDAATLADTTALAVTAMGADGGTAADVVSTLTASVGAADMAAAGDSAHIDATVNGGTDLGALDDSDALARVITAILAGIDSPAGPSDAVGYGDLGYGGGDYGGTPGGAVLTGTPRPAVDLRGVDEPDLILTGSPKI